MKCCGRASPVPILIAGCKPRYPPQGGFHLRSRFHMAQPYFTVRSTISLSGAPRQIPIRRGRCPHRPAVSVRCLFRRFVCPLVCHCERLYGARQSVLLLVHLCTAGVTDRRVASLRAMTPENGIPRLSVKRQKNALHGFPCRTIK